MATSDVDRVYGHETGHIFHAFDEYASSPSSNCTRTFNGELNANYQAGTCNGTAACVMISNSFIGSGATRHWDLCTHTPIHLGWSGMPTPPVALSPINDVVVTENPVVFHWDRGSPAAGVYSYVKIFDRNTDALAWCGYVGEVDTLAIDLINGQYRWLATQGLGNDFIGYAGVVGSRLNSRSTRPCTRTSIAPPHRYAPAQRSPLLTKAPVRRPVGNGSSPEDRPALGAGRRRSPSTTTPQGLLT
jgi:hypothetical protein